MHRDLKPANIFIDSKDNLKLGDLGLGRDFTSQTMEAFSRVGTPLYMSPEVLQGSGYDFKSDVWSLGCIAYELCALISPFKDENKKMSLYDLFTKINAG
jgi:NIMA (never in mitosis gene a)-related kinase